MKINAKQLKTFNACIKGYKNYLKVFGTKNVDMIEFLNSDKISVEDKHWVINRPWKNKKTQRVQRDFALYCAETCIDENTPTEIVDFFYICALINISEDFWLRYYATNSAADSSVYSAVDSAAYCAADSAAYYTTNSAADYAADSTTNSDAYYAAYYAARKQQIDIFIYCLENSAD